MNNPLALSQTTATPLHKEILGVEFEGTAYYTELTITDRDANGRLTGRINSSLVNCRFFWDKGGYPLPYCTMFPNRRGRVVPINIGKEFTRATINTLVRNTLVYHPSTTTGIQPQGTYVSQLILDGHVRKPHPVMLQNGKIFIRKASIVNPAKLNPDDLQRYEAQRDLLNYAIEAYQTMNPILSFEEWKLLQGTEVTLADYRAHYSEVFGSVVDSATRTPAQPFPAAA